MVSKPKFVNIYSSMMMCTREQLDELKGKDLIPIKCDCCNKDYQKLKRSIHRGKNRDSRKHYCSIKCVYNVRRKSIIMPCAQCSVNVSRQLNQLKRRNKSGNIFCNASCAALYNNTHKTFGIRRSKLEIWLEQKLTLHYPNLEFHFNRRDTINSELDIYIPRLKLAFELNGIFHYEPIFSIEKLTSTQNNDLRKFQACIEMDISLCVIDTSKQIRFKEQSANEFLTIIRKIVEDKLNSQELIHGK